MGDVRMLECVIMVSRVPTLPRGTRRERVCGEVWRELVGESKGREALLAAVSLVATSSGVWRGPDGVEEAGVRIGVAEVGMEEEEGVEEAEGGAFVVVARGGGGGGGGGAGIDVLMGEALMGCGFGGTGAADSRAEGGGGGGGGGVE